MAQIFILGLFIVALSNSISGNVLLPKNVGGCDQSIFVEDAVEIDAPPNAINCKWQIQTDKDHVLVFSIVQGANFKQVEEFLSIHDGLDVDSSVLLFENQKVYEVSNKNLPQSVYTTSSAAQIRFNKTPTSGFKLRIQKAVDCPFNLGAESQCGRVVDEISCYCATFTKRNHTDATSYCNSNRMKLLALESYSEELAIQSAWGTTTWYWTSGSDKSLEGKWIWESTGQSLSPGFTNWADGQPDNGGDNEDCLHLNYLKNNRVGWNDGPCSYSCDAICEAH